MTEPYVNPAEIPVKRNENVALGVLGALLFSVAGGLAHFGLMQFGYIAAISALVGMAASYFGYGLFSGRKNTVHGAILAVVFTMLMIVAAEYFTLAKEVFDVFKEEYEITFRDALAATPAFLEDPDVRSGVLKDLGFALIQHYGSLFLHPRRLPQGQGGGCRRSGGSGKKSSGVLRIIPSLGTSQEQKRRADRREKRKGRTSGAPSRQPV